MQLPLADWHQSISVQAVVSALGGGEMTRLVGGAVRDTLLGLVVKDVDLATRWKPEEVVERLQAAGIKAVPTGIDHGTITAVTDDGPIEITTLRRDVSTDGRRATIAFSEDWQEDAARRDFTINALFADPATLEISDYFCGLADLEARRIRFIGSPEQRIAEDYLRVMRYFRFLARFGQDHVDEDAFAACRAAASRLDGLSRERVADELLKLLATDDPRYAVGKMFEADLFSHIVVGVDENGEALFNRLLEREHDHAVSTEPLRRLVALLPKHLDEADVTARDLKLSNRQRKAIAARLDDQMPDPGSIRALAYRHGLAAARDTALLFGRQSDVAAMLEQLDDWFPPFFPLTGGDLIEMGLEAGPQVSETLARIESDWVAEGFPDENRLDEITKAHVADL